MLWESVKREEGPNQIGPLTGQVGFLAKISAESKKEPSLEVVYPRFDSVESALAARKGAKGEEEEDSSRPPGSDQPNSLSSGEGQGINGKEINGEDSGDILNQCMSNPFYSEKESDSESEGNNKGKRNTENCSRAFFQLNENTATEVLLNALRAFCGDPNSPDATDRREEAGVSEEDCERELKQFNDSPASKGVLGDVNKSETDGDNSSQVDSQVDIDNTAPNHQTNEYPDANENQTDGDNSSQVDSQVDIDNAAPNHQTNEYPDVNKSETDGDNSSQVDSQVDIDNTRPQDHQ